MRDENGIPMVHVYLPDGLDGVKPSSDVYVVSVSDGYELVKIADASPSDAENQLDQIREMIGLQFSDESVPEVLGKYLLHLERLVNATVSREP